jgi:hypothetical protein
MRQLLILNSKQSELTSSCSSSLFCKERRRRLTQRSFYGDMVVMSIEAYERKLFESEIYFKLKEAELEAKSTGVRYSHEEIFSDLKASLAGKVAEDNV